MRHFVTRFWRRLIHTSEAIDTSITDLFKPLPRILTPAETAFTWRLGHPDIPHELYRAALSHPLLTPSKEDSQKHEELNKTGGRVMDFFVKEYVKARFPKLPKDSLEMAARIFLSTRNIAAVSRSIGLEYAIVQFTGVPNRIMSTLISHIQNVNSEADLCKVSSSQVTSSILIALIGMIFQNKGALEVRKFLDSFFFSGMFNKDLLVRPRNPMLKLARALGFQKKSPPEYRLLHESGRLSNTSIYVVGVYTGLEKISEAHGPSLLVAQERSAVEALRKMFLVESANPKRSSDVLLNENLAVTDLDHLHELCKAPKGE